MQSIAQIFRFDLSLSAAAFSIAAVLVSVASVLVHASTAQADCMCFAPESLPESLSAEVAAEANATSTVDETPALDGGPTATETSISALPEAWTPFRSDGWEAPAGLSSGGAVDVNAHALNAALHPEGHPEGNLAPSDEEESTRWCISADDPRCSPAHPQHGGVSTDSGHEGASNGEGEDAERHALGALRSRPLRTRTGGGPAGIRTRVDRPPQHA